MKKTYMYAAAFSLVALTPSFASDVASLTKARDAIDAKIKALGPQIQESFESHAKDIQLDEKCMGEIMTAQGKAENVTDQACLTSWLDSLKAGKAMMVEDRPVFKEMQKLGKARMAVNMKLLEALLAQKK